MKLYYTHLLLLEVVILISYIVEQVLYWDYTTDLLSGSPGLVQSVGRFTRGTLPDVQ